VLFHADVQVIVHCGRRGQQDDGCLGSQFRLGAADQLFADAEALVADAHRQVGEVAAIAPIGERARDADQQVAGPGRHDEVGLIEHLLHAGAVVHRAALAQGGGAVELDGDVEVEGGVGVVGDHVKTPSPYPSP